MQPREYVNFGMTANRGPARIAFRLRKRTRPDCGCEPFSSMLR